MEVKTCGLTMGEVMAFRQVFLEATTEPISEESIVRVFGTSDAPKLQQEIDTLKLERTMLLGQVEASQNYIDTIQPTLKRANRLITDRE